MTFTLLTVIIFLILGLVVFRASVRGHAQGFARAGIDFIIIIFSLVIGSILSSLVFAVKVGKRIIAEFDLDEMIAELSESIGGNFETLFSALITMIVSSIVFLLVYGVLITVCRIIVALVFKTALHSDPNDVGFIGENEPWFRRNSNKLGAIFGGISGFLAVVICVAPVIGTFKTADKVIDILQGFDMVNEKYDDTLEAVEKYTDDFGVTVLYYCGGKIVYDLGARTSVDGNTVILSREINTAHEISYDVKKLYDNFKDLSSVGTEDFLMAKDLCDTVSDSYFLSVLVADVVSGAARSWKADEDFMGTYFPIENDTLSPMFDSVLGVFASSTYETVSGDLSTFIDICVLLIDSGLVDAGSDYDSLMEILEDGSVMNKLTVILEGNPRMAFITDTLYRTAMKTLVKTIKFDGYDVSEYEGLINDITGQLNRLQGQKVEKKVETLTDYAVQYMTDYGVDVPESVAEMVVSAMINEIPADEYGYVDPSQVSQFFDKYYTPAE